MKERCLGLDNSRYCTGWSVIDVDVNVNVDVDVETEENENKSKSRRKSKVKNSAEVEIKAGAGTKTGIRTKAKVKESKTGMINKDVDLHKSMKIIDFGFLDSSKIKEEGKTLIFLEERFTQLIEKFKPTVIIAEQQFIGKNAQTGLVLAGIHAIMKLVAAKHNISICYYPVLTMKSVTLNGIKLKKADGTRKTGNEIKQEVKQEIFNIFYDVDFNNITDDVTDAISAVITYVKLNGKPVGKQSANRKSKQARKKLIQDEK